ncbi:MAG: DNA polymerase III subunit delta [Tannerella sp.]|jgi:DNA polymerase-3 subunit delta|nr:DNA polymerase III subunit delta [Tannerella sp.]
MAKQEFTYNDICREIRAGQFRPVYVLTGEEPYFIDRITDLLLEKVVTGAERDFNQIILYGADVTAADVLNAARRFPMMSERQLVVVREAQLISDMELLTNYVKKPLASTVLVINYKFRTLDRRKALAAAVEKNGLLFDSKKIPDYRMPEFVAALLQQRAFTARQDVVLMLVDCIGNDLERLNKELDKLEILLNGQAGKRLTPELIEKNIGISKDFNNFELQSAIARRDILKANRIIRYFEKDPTGHPIQATLPVLFNYFSNLMICHYAPDKSERSLMATLGFRFPIQIKDYLTGMRNYPAMKVFFLIHEIRMADAHSKGVDATSSLTNGDILKELLYKILH